MDKNFLKYIYVVVSLIFSIFLLYFKIINPDCFQPELIKAAKTGDLETVQKLIAEGADINEKNLFKHETALMWAAITFYPSSNEIIKTLVNAGAEIDCKDRRGRTALMYLAGRSFEIADLEVIKLLIDKGADVNAQDEKLTPVLEFAVNCSSRIEVVKEILDRGADAKKSIWPLISAVNCSRIDLAKLLIERGANVNVASCGHTPLQFAKKNGPPEMVKILEAAGAKE